MQVAYPKSVCQCGHSGDGPDSDHGSANAVTSQLQPGHGKCSVPGCKCEQFTWSDFTEQYKGALAVSK